MEVGVNVEAEDMVTGVVQFCCHGYFTLVSSNRKILDLVVPSSMRERRRYHEAQERRNARLSIPVVKPKPCLPHDPSHLQTGQEQETTRYSRSGSFTESRPRISVQDQLSVTCSETYTEVIEIVHPQHCDSNGITFGGNIMKWMEYCAYMAANRHTRSDMLIASIDSLNFLHPTRQATATD